jgi:hypothetical protein
MSNWWEKKPKKEELEGMNKYVEKKLEVAKEGALGATKEDMLDHFEEEDVEKFEANFPWKDISFDEYLLLMGYDINFYHEAGERVLNLEDIKKEKVENWHKVVKEYNTKTINQYKNIDARKMHKWLMRNISFNKYIKKYNQINDKEVDNKWPDVTVYNQMLKDYIVGGIIPPFNNIEPKKSVFFDPSTMKVVDVDELPGLSK